MLVPFGYDWSIDIIGMKIFLGQNSLLVTFLVFDCKKKWKKFHLKKVSSVDLLLVPFGFKNFLGSNFSKTKFIACYCLFSMKCRYHRDENISETNLLLVTFWLWLEYRYYKCHRNENISGTNLLLVPFCYD